MPKPLQYNRKRGYLRTDDHIDDLLDTPLVVNGTLGLPDFNTPLDTRVALPGAEPHANIIHDLAGLPSTDFDSSAVTAMLPQRANNMKKCGGETVGAFITSRKSVRPRHRRDPGLKRIWRKTWNRAPLWMQPGFCSRPKYRPGVATREYPWAGNLLNSGIVGPRGGAWAARR